MYADHLIVEGNRLFNKGEYKKAAKLYEKAAQWSINELADKPFTLEAYRLAIISWLSALKPEKASKLIEHLPQEDKIALLKDMCTKIIRVVDSLVKKGNYKLAVEFLNTFIRLYHLNELPAELQQLNEKQLELLKLMTKSSKKFRKII
ncbi:MAG: hypothetical protein ACFE96_13575 [Candidatus Hermodarchaeota archaeon]